MVTYVRLRNLQTVFQSGCTIFHSQQQCMRAPISSYPRPHLLLPEFLILALLVGMRCYLPMVLNQCPVLQVGDGGRKNWANQSTWKWAGSDCGIFPSDQSAEGRTQATGRGDRKLSHFSSRDGRDLGHQWGGLEIRPDFRISRESDLLRETETEALSSG